MSSVRELHDHAMSLADQLLAAKRRGHVRVAERLARDAFHAELEAATIAFNKQVSAATRIILLRSAAHLAREARLWEEGLDLAMRAMGAEDLREYRTELFRICDTLRTYEHLAVHGIKLEDADLQLTVAGPEAAPGFARADEVTRRVKQVRSLVERSVMRKLGLPYEADTPRSQQFKQVFTPFLSEPRAASYALTLKFGVDEQWEFPELLLGVVRDQTKRRKRLPSVVSVLDDVMEVADAYAAGGPKTVGKVLKDEAYAKNASELFRHLSPDSERIDTVGLTVVRDGHSRSVALPDRDAFEDRPHVWFSEGPVLEALPARIFELVGRLLEGDATTQGKEHAKIVLDSGEPIKFFYDEARHGDIIADYWKERVRVKLRREGQRAVLEDLLPGGRSGISRRRLPR